MKQAVFKQLTRLSAVLCLLMTTVTGAAQTTVDESQVTILTSISSTGQQAFNTGYTHKANTRVVMDCNVTQNSRRTWEALLGGRKGSYQSNAFCFFSRTDGNDIPCFNRSGHEPRGTGFVYGERIILTCEGQTATWVRYSDQNTVAGSVTTTGTADDGKTPMFLFDLNTSNTEGGLQEDNSKSVMTLYGCQIYEGTTLKCDFVPAKYNNVVGLYDRVNHTFSGSITGSSFDEGSTKMENYERAINTIVDGQHYYVFTMYNGQKYYLTADGYLSSNNADAQLFCFVKARGKEYEFGFMLQNGFTYFTNPVEESDAALTKGHLNTTDENSRHNWEAQVFFLNSDGKYAIRSTNAASGTTGWNRIGSAFWTVNPGASGPLAEYSFDMNYVWQLETGSSSIPIPSQELLTNGQCDGTYNGWTKTDGGSGWAIDTNDGVSYWKSSHQTCTLSQTVTLADHQISAESVDNGEVWCSISAEMKSSSEKNGDGARVCKVTVDMLDGNDNSLGIVTVLNDNSYYSVWEIFRTAPFILKSGTRKLTYRVSAQDAPNWAGQFGPCFKNLSLKAIVGSGDDITSNYLRALNTIEHGECYRVFTMYNGQKYYVTADGHLSSNVDDAPLFGFIKVAGEEYDYGFKLKNGDTYFTNPAELNESALTNGHLNTTTKDSRNTWEAQVFFLNTQGKYAIRSTNAQSSTDHSKWAWIGSAYWTVDEGTEGPLAQYSWDMNYVWQIEKGENDALLPVWIGSKQVSLYIKDDVLGDGKVRYTPGEGSGTLTFTTSTPTIDGVHSWSEVLSDGREYQFSSKIYAEGIDLTVNAPTGLTLSATGEEYGIYVGNEGDLTINGNFSMTAGGSAICVDKGDLTINGNFNSTTSKVGITVREGNVRATGDVYVKNTSQYTTSIALNNGYLYLGPGKWEIDAAGTAVFVEKQETDRLWGGIVMPFTHEICNPAYTSGETKIGDDNKTIMFWDGNSKWEIARHVIIQKKENWIAPSNTIDLSTLTADCVVPDNTRLTGTLNGFYKVSIADGATVSFYDVNINIDPSGYDEVWDTQYRWAGITCEGNATIFLENTNTVKGFCNEFPGIYVPEGKTLLIYGSGTLNAISGGNPNGDGYYLIASGIGGGYNLSCGNIIINEGTVTATGGNSCAGIGGGWSEEGVSVRCGNITINGGTVTATTGNYGAGIGSGLSYNETSTCGNITITGGTVTATGGFYGAGIGSGTAYETSSGCGDITISGGTVTAKSGSFAAAIGTGLSFYSASSYCGDITITNDIEKVVAMTDYRFVGAGDQGTCGTITIGDNLGSEEKEVDGGYSCSTIQAKEKIKYSLWIGETQVTYLNKGDILGNGSVSYKPYYTSGTLTFTGTPAISGYHENARIYAKDISLTIKSPENGLTLNSEHDGIHIEGNKELIIDGDVTINSSSSVCIKGTGNVTVNGKLILKSEMDAIWLTDGDVTINGTVEIEQAYTGIDADNVIVKGSFNAQNNKNRGIRANGNVTIDGDIIATATGGSEPVAIYCMGDITIVSGEVYLTGDVAALQAKGTITIPVTSRVITPWNGRVKKMGNFSYIFAEEGTNPATEVSIRLKDCDVNHDGSVNIADALCIVNYVLGNTPDNFDWNRYELNGDHKITIADAAVVVEMILSGLAK